MANRTHTSSASHLSALVLFLVLNILILDGVVIWKLTQDGAVLGTTTNDSCPAACVTRINQIAGKTTTSTNVKEYFVPLGSGTNATDDWADIQGVSAQVDTAAYGKIKKVTFEATVAQPVSSQKVWVRLFNATDKHPVWYSEVVTDSAGPILLISPAITLDAGNKLYQVQMKTQLKGVTSLTQSRLHITTY